MKVYGIPYTRTYTEFCGILRYCAVKFLAELRKIKSVPYKICFPRNFKEALPKTPTLDTSKWLGKSPFLQKKAQAKIPISENGSGSEKLLTGKTFTV